MSKYYVVIATNDIADEMIEESLNDSNSFRKCNDDSLSILKFNTEHPNTMQGYLKRDHDEIVEYLSENSADWELPA